ncbi:MAG: hypothetical protein JWP91_4159 [Fibrobacteres bacterium]|nr:hypothetical protein [Fibrobacterota bacterium]
MKKLALLIAAAAACLSLQNCAKSPTDKSGDPDTDPAAAQAKSDSEASAMLIPVYEINRSALERQRLTGLKASSEEPQLTVQAGLPAFGTLPGDNAPELKAKDGPNIAGALLKAGSGGSGWQSAGPDTAYFLPADSALGSLRWVHIHTVIEAGATVDAADTLVYKWPHNPANPTVLGHYGSRSYGNGSRLAYSVTDEDGDKILNEAVAPKSVQLLKSWTTLHGDTTWKSLLHTVHGATTFYDSIGKGEPSSWTDSVFVSGKLLYSVKIMDGDGNGLVNTAKAGAKVKITRDSYTDKRDGTFLYAYETFGPGADGKFETEADNVRYPFQSLLVSAAGDLAKTVYGDGDGDGLYWDPASTGTNRAWITNEYAVSDSVTASGDSLAQTLSGADGSVKKIAFYSSVRKFKDGRVLRNSTRLPGGAGAFSGNDTVEVWETLDLTAFTAKTTVDPRSGLDSTLRVTWMIPGDLGSAADDKITRWYTRTWPKGGQSSVSASELFTPDVAIGPGETPKSGTLVRESRSNPTSSKSVIRTVLFQEFSAASANTSWKRTDYFENGDSAISNGGGSLAGAGSYSRELGRGARNSGTYDAKTGLFQDTVFLLGFTGAEKSREIAWGTFDAAKGTGDYRCKRIGGKDTATAHILIAPDGSSGFLLTRTSASGSAAIAIHGDSAVLVATTGKVERTYIWTSMGGTYKVAQRDVTVGSGNQVATGEYFFGMDYSGNGTCHKTPSGKSASDSQVQFQADGTLYVDGVKVTP